MLLRHDAIFFDGIHGIQSPGRLTRVDLDFGIDAMSRQTRSGQQSPAADGAEQDVEIRHVAQQFQGGGSLPCNHVGIVKGFNPFTLKFLHQIPGKRIRIPRIGRNMDDAPVFPNRRPFDGINRLRHHEMRFFTQQQAGKRNALGMIP